MEFEPEEQQIVDLLSKLKNQGGAYPKKLLASRRQIFLSQMASVGLGLGVGTGIKAAAKTSKGGTLSHLPAISAGSIVETVLVLVIVAQAGVIAYNYRDRVIDLVNALASASTPTEVSVPVTGSSPTDIVVSETPTVIATETPTASPSSTVTVIPPTSESGNGNGTSSSGGNNTTPAVTTPQPTNDNNGNHYGQTPRPTQEKSNPKATQSTGGGNGNGKKP